MLKIFRANINSGFQFQIRNAWREAIAKTLNTEVEHYPFSFEVSEVRGDGLFCCKSVCSEEEDAEYKIVVSEDVLRYVSGTEIDDINVGLYFKDYFPIEGTSLLLFNNDNKKVNAYKLKIDISRTNKMMAKLEFNLTNLLDDSIVLVSECDNCSWKMLHGPDTYMNEVEKMFQDTFIHKEFLMITCKKFAGYLESQGLEEEASELMARAKVHDNSKILNKDEFRALTTIINDKSCLKDATQKLSAYKQDAIELHWKHNAHHPEHFENVEDMGRLDRLEMICDWAARSLQYGTDLIEFVEKRQEDRFHFPELMYQEILCNCKILTDLLNKNK